MKRLMQVMAKVKETRCARVAEEFSTDFSSTLLIRFTGYIVTRSGRSHPNGKNRYAARVGYPSRMERRDYSAGAMRYCSSLPSGYVYVVSDSFRPG